MKNRFLTASGKLAMMFTGLAVISIFIATTSSEAQTPAPALPSGVQDVMKLSKAGMTEDVIIAQVKNAGATYNLSADQLIYLSNQGVSQNVIKALLQGNGSASVPAAPPISPSAATPVVPGAPQAPVAPVAPSAPAVTPPLTPPGAPGSTPPVSFDYFHDQLSSAGTWVDEPGYGLCWSPSVAVSDPYWRPYLDGGHWVYTDSGWFWQSDYPWGEVVFHYGRWHRGRLGWLWVPGYDWAPAWVCWRQSEGYCGWAPLPPGAVFRAGIGLTFNGRVGVDLDFGLDAAAFTFVPFDHFWEHNLHGFLLPHDRVDFIFGKSFVANGYRFDHGRFVVEGLGRDRIAMFTHHEIRVERPVFRDERITGHFESERRDFHDERRDDRRDDRRDGHRF